MTINFVLPFPPRVPGGGTKVMYEYANRLAGKGHTVFFYHAIKTSYFAYRVPYVIRLFYFRFVEKRLPKWFTLDARIKSVNVPFVADKFINDADVIVSSWWSTAFEVNALSSSKGKKFNFVQDYEVWIGHEDRVHESYLLPATKIIYVQYLQEVFKKYKAEPAAYIPIGIDRRRFFLSKDIPSRPRFSLVMLYSEEPRKNTQLGIRALVKLKSLFPQLAVTLFGVFPKPTSLPAWITYFEKPDNLNEIFNGAAIYVTPSLQEGWALPPAEAMTCGCAVVCSDIPGHQDYASESTAVQFNPNDEDGMVAAVSRLLNDDALRVNLAINGNKFCERYDWDKASDAWEKLLLKSIHS